MEIISFNPLYLFDTLNSPFQDYFATVTFHTPIKTLNLFEELVEGVGFEPTNPWGTGSHIHLQSCRICFNLESCAFDLASLPLHSCAFSLNPYFRVTIDTNIDQWMTHTNKIIDTTNMATNNKLISSLISHQNA